jgi:hypothetical protein
MKSFIIKALTCLQLLSGLAIPAPAQTVIGPGWARNSINTTVFRKNSVASFNGIQYVSYYDSIGNVILAKRTIGTQSWTVNKTNHSGTVTDAHRSISIGIDGEGFIHMAWDHHNNSLRYCKSKAPASLDMDAIIPMISTQENDVTYPEFFRMPDGDLIFMYRYGLSGNGNLVINKYSLASHTWTRLHNVLIDGQGQRNAYWQSCIDKKGTIHVSWVWRETWDVATNHDICYAKSPDGGLTWYKTNGTQYAIPITAATAEYAKIIPHNSTLINQTSMYADTSGRPYIASYWKPAGSSMPEYQMVYHDGTNWHTKQITKRQNAFSLGGGGTKRIPISRPQLIVDDRDDTLVAYLIYRDLDRGSKISMNVSIDPAMNLWKVYDLTSASVYSYEPSYDTDLWKDSSMLHIFAQKAGQGDGETLEMLPAQDVYIIEFQSAFIPADTLDLNPVTAPAKSDNPRNSKSSQEKRIHPQAKRRK